MEEYTAIKDHDAVSTLMTVPSIGELTARVLVNQGFKDLEHIEKAGMGGILNIRGMGEKKARDIMDEIRGTRGYTAMVVSEFFCPYCEKIVTISSEICHECGRRYTDGDEWVFLPDGGVLDEPLEALAEMDMKIAEGRDNEGVWYVRGCIQESMGAFESANECYDRVVEMNPHFATIWNTKARLATKMGRLKDATQAYRLAVDHRTMGSEVLYNMYGREKEVESPSQGDGTEEIVEKISQAKKMLSRARNTGFDLTRIKESLKVAVRAKETGELEKAEECARDVVDHSRMAVLTFKLLEKGRRMVGKQDIPSQEGFKRVEDLVDQGMYREALSLAQELIRKIE